MLKVVLLLCMVQLIWRKKFGDDESRVVITVFVFTFVAVHMVCVVGINSYSVVVRE